MLMFPSLRHFLELSFEDEFLSVLSEKASKGSKMWV